MLLFRTKDFQLFGFRPKDDHGSWSAYGVAWRRRVAKGRPNRDIWLNNHVRFHRKAKPIPGGKGCYTYEWESWKSEGVTSLNRKRLTVKKFVRLKVGLGGARPGE